MKRSTKQKITQITIVSLWFLVISFGTANALFQNLFPKSGGPPASDLGLSNLQAQIKTWSDAMTNAMQQIGNQTGANDTAREQARATAEQANQDSRFIVSSAGRSAEIVNADIVQGGAASTANALAIDVQMAAMASSSAADDLTDAIVDGVVNYYNSMTPEQILADYINEGIEDGFIARSTADKYASKDPNERLALISKAFADAQNTDHTCGVSCQPPNGNRNVNISGLTGDRGGSIPGQGLPVDQAQPQAVLWANKRFIVAEMVEHPKPNNGSDQLRGAEYNLAEFRYINGAAEGAQRYSVPVRQLMHHGAFGQANQAVGSNTSFFIKSAYASTGGSNNQVDSNAANLRQQNQQGLQIAQRAHLLESAQNASANDLAHAQTFSISANAIAGQAAALPKPARQPYINQLGLQLSSDLTAPM